MAHIMHNERLSGMKESYYNLHAAPQASVVARALPQIISAANAIALPADRPLQVAEFGCSHGVNSIEPVKAVLGALQARLEAAVYSDERQRLLDVVVSHEDLPTNSWRELFACVEQYLRESCSHVHISSAAVGRSFYQRCFPSNYLHLGFSMNALHWQSHCPCPLSNSIFPPDPAVPESERAVWRASAMADLTRFLQLRAQEFVPGGYLVISYVTATMTEPTDEFVTTLSGTAVGPAYKALHAMVHDGLFTQEDLHNMTVPVWYLVAEEQEEVYEGVGDLWEMVGPKEFITTHLPAYSRYTTGEITAEQFGQAISDFWRALLEGIMTNGLCTTRTQESAQRLLDEYFMRLAAMAAAAPAPSTFYSTLLTLRRR